jgi:iron complex transport system permease protein
MTGVVTPSPLVPSTDRARIRAAGTATAGFARRRAVRVVGLVVAVGVLVVVVLLSLGVGSLTIPIRDVIRAFTDFDGSNEHLVVRELRVPRTVVGVLVGAALGVAGALMQAITRNPLADPGLLGVNAGASLAVVFGIAVFGLGSLTAYVWFAFLGAMLTAVTVYALGSIGRGGATPVRLALAGAALSALLGSFTSAIVLLDRQTLDQYRFWAVGSLSGRDEAIMVQVAPFIVVGLLVALACARPLNTLGLGEETARALGTNIGWTRAATALAVTLLCGAATAACGPIGFIGLVVPLAARVITGPDQRWLLPYSAVLGPVVLLSCDIVGRVIARPGEVQVGIMTAAIGGPAFVVLVRRVRMAQL